jgi:hypothetical protein
LRSVSRPCGGRAIRRGTVTGPCELHVGLGREVSDAAGGLRVRSPRERARACACACDGRAPSAPRAGPMR